MLKRVWFMGVVSALAFAGMALAQGGPGGWWNRVTPTTPEQKAYVAEVQKLHVEIRQKVGELRTLQALPNPSAAAVQAKQAEIDGLRDRLAALNTRNHALIQQMAPQGGRAPGAVPGGCPFGGPGVCPGPCNGVPGSACPFGGPGAGRGMGYGRGMGAGRGMGYGRGMGAGRGYPRR